MGTERLVNPPIDPTVTAVGVSVQDGCTSAGIGPETKHDTVTFPENPFTASRPMPPLIIPGVCISLARKPGFRTKYGAGWPAMLHVQFQLPGRPCVSHFPVGIDWSFPAR